LGEFFIHTRNDIIKQYKLVLVKCRRCPTVGKVTVGLAGVVLATRHRLKPKSHVLDRLCPQLCLQNSRQLVTDWWRTSRAISGLLAYWCYGRARWASGLRSN